MWLPHRRVFRATNVAAMGGAVANPLSGWEFAHKYDVQEYWEGGTQLANLAAATGYTHTHSNAVQYVDSDASIESFASDVPAINGYGYHPNGSVSGRLVNAGTSSNLADQSVTVSAQVYTLRFRGTGSVGLSNAHTATLNGTGADDWVDLQFTPSVGTLDLDATGTVQYATLTAGNFADTDVGPIIATAGSAVTVGPSVLSVTDALADVDQLLVAILKVPSARSGVSDTAHGRIAAWGTGNNILIDWNDVSRTPQLQVNNGAALHMSKGSNLTGGTTYGIAVRRLYGNWRGGDAPSSMSAMSWWGADSTVAWNSPNSTLGIGHGHGGNYADSPILRLGRKLGTLGDDAAVLAAIAELAA